MAINTICSECGGTMQEGYILDITPSGRVQSSWIEGQPETSFLHGFLTTKGKQAFYTIAYRCKSCGFLKFYAGPTAIEE